MAEAESPSNSSSIPLFLEVKCKSTGKTRRFAIGTEAGFAVSIINRKLISEPKSESENCSSLALHIEAFKENEEPINFGPNSVLVDFGDGWVLQTVTESDYLGVEHGVDGVRPLKNQARSVNVNDYKPLKDDDTEKKSKPIAISYVYIAKIIFAFILLFVFGAIFTIILENLPEIVSFTDARIKLLFQ